MIIKLPILALALLVGTACTTILTEVTGDEGFREDPTIRSAGTVVEDESIETRIVVNMRSREPEFRNATFNVNSHNGIVLLVGQVQSEALKERATEIAVDTSSNIRRIHNELEVAERRSLIARGNDTWLATKVRTQLAANDDITGGRIRVVANNGQVFLMGIVPRDEGDRATRLTRNVGGVTRVITVFEYLGG